MFQSTHSLRSATAYTQVPRTGEVVSIHALLAECDEHFRAIGYLDSGFNPRTPCGVRPAATGWALETVSAFQSTHSLRSATRKETIMKNQIIVSIHALLAECDLQYPTNNKTIESFNPRTPCGVRRVLIVRVVPRWMFQSTHSLRSATIQNKKLVDNLASFNPRTPCGVRRTLPLNLNCSTWFQSTHSLRSATYYEDAGRYAYVVSIHALLAECDLSSWRRFQDW